MKRLAIALVLLVSLAGRARAQDILVEGPGIKVGEATVIHPRLGVEAGVVSNVFYDDRDDVASPIMRLRAGLDLTPAGQQRLGDMTEAARTVEFRAGADLQYIEYLTSNSRARSQRNLDADVRGNVQFFPQSNATFVLDDRYQRLTRPTNFESNQNLARDVNHFRAEFTLQPRGHNISGGPRYENIIDVFESDRSQFADRMTNILGLRANWKFFPYTQVYLDGTLSFNSPLGDAAMAYKRSSTPLEVVAGLDTVLTETTTINARLGYTNGFYDSPPSYSTVIGGINFGWRYTPTGRVVMTYNYNVHDSINANYYGEHQASVGVNQQIRTVVATAGVGARLRGYRGVPPELLGPGVTDTSRDDVILEANARGDWILQDRYSLYLEYGVQSVNTDFRTMGIDDPSYIRHEAVLGIIAAF